MSQTLVLVWIIPACVGDERLKGEDRFDRIGQQVEHLPVSDNYEFSHVLILNPTYQRNTPRLFQSDPFATDSIPNFDTVRISEILALRRINDCKIIF